MSKMVRVGFIGAGGIAKAHLNALKKVDNVQIVGIYDIVQASADLVAEMHGAKRFDDPYELIDTKHIDVLFVCTPPFARSDYETTAARKGVHLFAEKPPGLQLDGVSDKVEIIKNSGIINSSGHSSRYSAGIQKAKEFLAGRQIDLIHLFRYHGLPKQPWLAKMETSGGQMVDQTIHDVDAVRYLVGDFKDVYARFDQRSLKQVDENADIYDVGAVTFTLNTGAVGSVTTTNLLPGFSRRELMLIGNNFTIIVDRSKRFVLIADGKEVEKFEYSDDQMGEQDRTFIEAVRSGSQEQVLCSYEEAYKTLKVVLAMNESAISGQPVLIN